LIENNIKTIKLVLIAAYPLSARSFNEQEQRLVGIGKTCPSGPTYLPVDCCIGELAL